MQGKGRQLITLKDLPEGWEESIINLAKKGASIVELAVELDISRGTIYSIINREPLFKELIINFKEVSKKINRVNITKEVLKLREKRRNKRDHKKEYESNKFAISARSLLAYHLRNNGKTKSKKVYSKEAEGGISSLF